MRLLVLDPPVPVPDSSGPDGAPLALVTLNSDHTPGDVALLSGASELRLGPRASRVTIRDASVGGTPFNLDVLFDLGVMQRVTLIARRPGDARTWAEWSMDQETARKAFHEEWATRALGARFEPLRVEVDGRWITTDWPEPAPRQATMPWGQLRSVYDQHTATAMLVMLIGFVGG